MHIKKPLVSRSATKPAKIMDLKCWYTPSDPIDIRPQDWEGVNLSFTYAKVGLEYSPATYLRIKVVDFDYNTSRSSLVPMSKNINLWTEFAKIFKDYGYELDPEDDISPEEIPDVTNYKVQITPINDAGEGPSSVFFIPLKDLNIENVKNTPCFYRNYSLNKYWHLFSETPNERKNRPKTMHIYIDVPEEDVEEDRLMLNGDQWWYTSLGNARDTNMHQYRWVINDNQLRKLTFDGWVDGTEEEEDFINGLLKEMRQIFMRSLAQNSLIYGDPIIVKTVAMNPTDENDSIIIYVMKEKRWEL